MATAKLPIDPVVDRYILQLQQRHRQFLRDRKADLKEVGMDSFGRIYHDYFAFPSKPAYDALLQVILEPAERDRLQIDPQFTQAWHIFVDLCWVHKRATRAGILFGLVVFSLGFVGIIFWQSPQLGGKTMMGIIGIVIIVWALPYWLNRRSD